MGVADTAVDMAVEDIENIEAETLVADWAAEPQADQDLVHIAHFPEHNMVFCNAHNYIFLHMNWSYSSPRGKNVINNINLPIKMLILIF